MGFGSSPSYSTPPAAPPAANPATMASAVTANTGSSARKAANAGTSTIATSPEGIASGEVNRAMTKLGGVS